MAILHYFRLGISDMDDAARRHAIDLVPNDVYYEPIGIRSDSMTVARARARRKTTGKGKARRPIGVDRMGTAELIRRIEAGISYDVVERLQRALRDPGPVPAFSELVRISPRTLARRRHEGRLRPDESERVLRLARVYEKALKLHEGDTAATHRWLTSPKMALNDRTPLEFAKTEPGAQEVERLIIRLEYGVFS